MIVKSTHAPNTPGHAGPRVAGMIIMVAAAVAIVTGAFRPESQLTNAGLGLLGMGLLMAREIVARSAATLAVGVGLIVLGAVTILFL